MQKVIVLNRTKCVQLTHNDFSLNRVIVSISSLGDNRPSFNRNNHSISDVLYVFFDDEEDGKTSISDDDAKKIASFVKQWYDKVDQIVVHCDAGVSRSAGVAAAILKYFTKDDSAIFDNPMYCPNMKCYRKVSAALYGNLPPSQAEMLEQRIRYNEITGSGEFEEFYKYKELMED